MTHSQFLSRLMPLVPACTDISRYEKQFRVGEGAYGIVYKAKDKDTGCNVALKRVRDHEQETEGIPITSIREIQILKMTKHPSIVELKDVAINPKDKGIFLVFEFVAHDLAVLVERMKREEVKGFNLPEIKRLLVQLLQAVDFMHSNWIIHRDLKLPNLLYSESGRLKIADFGLARIFGKPTRPLTPRVVTLWYRPPELLFGAESYSTALDMWAVGCIMGELLTGSPLLPGINELDQIHRICNLLGSPTSEIWPGFDDLPETKHINLPHQPYNNLKEKFHTLSQQGLDLMSRLLRYDPNHRMSAGDALQHPFFQEQPIPAEESTMPTFPAQAPYGEA